MQSEIEGASPYRVVVGIPSRVEVLIVWFEFCELSSLRCHANCFFLTCRPDSCMYVRVKKPEHLTSYAGNRIKLTVLC